MLLDLHVQLVVGDEVDVANLVFIRDRDILSSGTKFHHLGFTEFLADDGEVEREILRVSFIVFQKD